MGITRINTNIEAFNAQRNVNITSNNLSKSIERLSSGLRINTAGDDAAGLSVANRLRTQRQGLDVAVANAQDGINVISVAEGALEETTNRLNRIRELAIQAANTGVNDFAARSSIQDEVFQSIDEITRIANTTQFGSNFLLNGDFSIESRIKPGTDGVGVNIDSSPVASTLSNGTSFLNIQQVQQGFAEIVTGDAVGEAQILNSGIVNQSDVAVSLGVFTTNDTGFHSGVSLGAGGSAFGTAFFNGVSTSADAAANDVFNFQGVLSDGVTQFVGSVSAAQASDVDGLVSAINEAIDDAESALFGVTAASVPTSFRTSASVGTGENAGRIVLGSSGQFINQSSIDLTLNRDGTQVTSARGVTRSGEIGANSFFTGTGNVGNSVTAITGSTFGDGSFDIQVSDVQDAQQRTLETGVIFRDANGSIIDRTTTLNGASAGAALRLNGSFVGGIYTGGTSLTSGDTITLTGTNADGTTFQANYTFDPGTAGVDDSTALNDFEFGSISGLVRELNFRTRDYAAGTGTDGEQTRFEDALFTFTSSGTIQLVDDFGRDNSQMGFTFTFGSGAGAPENFTFSDEGNLIQEGFSESATFRIDGGEAIRANAGEVVTLTGAESTQEGIPTPQVTFRVGNDLQAGTDRLRNTQNLYTGNLNGGPTTTFAAGDQNVVFFTEATNDETVKFLTVDFDSIIDVTNDFTGSSSGETVLISTVNRGLNFQVGAQDEQNFALSIGNLRANNLGFGQSSGRTVEDINVTSLTGANEAIRIIDEALNQVNRTRSLLGASTNRLESTVANLSVASENLTASESRIRDADIATETTDFATNQVLLQAGTSVLAQANFQTQGFLQLLG